MTRSINSSFPHQAMPSVQSLDVGSLLDVKHLATTPAVAGGTSIALSILTGLSGLFGALYGGYLTKEGVQETRRAIQCHDRTGVMSGVANTAGGATFAGMGATMFGSSAVTAFQQLGCPPTSLSESFGRFCTSTVDWLGLVMYGLYLFGSVVNLFEHRAFQKAWNDMLSHPRMTEQTKVLESLRFLELNLSLSEPEKKSARTPEEIQILLQKKRDRLLRCLGKDCVLKIESDLPKLLRDVKKGNLTEAKEFIHQVKRANFKQKAVHITMCVAGIIGMAGSALSLCLGGGLICIPFFAVASVLYWCNDPISRLAQKFYVPSTDTPQVVYKSRYALV